MIKTFYKRRDPYKLVFDRNMKHRSYAYGKDVSLDFIDWRDRFIKRWNKLNDNFLVFEHGDIGANGAKMDIAGEARLESLDGVPVKQKLRYGLQPLWFDNILLETSEEGYITVNGERTDINLGTDLKAWAICPVWDDGILSYSLFVISKPPKSEKTYLSVHKLDKKLAIEPKPAIKIELNSTLDKRSALYCYGRHIFVVHEARLEYYFYTPNENLLEAVPLGDDEPNEDKKCTLKIRSPIVMNSKGYVFWQADNNVYGFPIGYPRRLLCIEGGDRAEVTGIQCYNRYLFVYRRNTVSNEYTSTRYSRADESSPMQSAIFNTGAISNVFYAERGGLLYYVKITSGFKKFFLTKNDLEQEQTFSQLGLKDADEIFCMNGRIYTDIHYVGYDEQRHLMAIKR